MIVSQLLDSLAVKVILGVLLIQLLMLAFYFSRKSSSSKCPVCGSGHGERRRRPVVVRIFLAYFSGLKYYRCMSCQSHFFVTGEGVKPRVSELTDSDFNM